MNCPRNRGNSRTGWRNGSDWPPGRRRSTGAAGTSGGSRSGWRNRSAGSSRARWSTRTAGAGRGGGNPNHHELCQLHQWESSSNHRRKLPCQSHRNWWRIHSDWRCGRKSDYVREWTGECKFLAGCGSDPESGAELQCHWHRIRLLHSDLGLFGVHERYRQASPEYDWPWPTRTYECECSIAPGYGFAYRTGIHSG